MGERLPWNGTSGASHPNHFLHASAVILGDSTANPDTSGREVVEVSTPNVTVVAKTAVTSERTNNMSRLMHASVSEDVVRQLFEEFLTLEDTGKISTDSRSEDSFAGFIEEDAHCESPRELSCDHHCDDVAEIMNIPRHSPRHVVFTDGGFPKFLTP